MQSLLDGDMYGGDTYMSGGGSRGAGGKSGKRGGLNADEPFTPLDKELHANVLRYGLGGEAYGFEQDPEEEKVCAVRGWER